MAVSKAKSLNFLKVTGEILGDVIDLVVAPDETHLIATNAEWLAEAAHIADSVSFGIFDGTKPVGLISLIDPRLIDEDDDKSHYQPDCLFVWRVMIDKDNRGSGHGRTAIKFACDYARLIGLSGVSLTTMDRDKGNALPFYTGIGFTPTGRRLDDEIELVLKW